MGLFVGRARRAGLARDHFAVKSFDRGAAGSDEQCRYQRLNQAREAAADHRQAEARSDAEVFRIRFADAFWMGDEPTGRGLAAPNVSTA